MKSILNRFLVNVCSPAILAQHLKGFDPAGYTTDGLIELGAAAKDRETSLQRLDTSVRQCVKGLRTVQLEIRKELKAREAAKARVEHERKLKAQKDADPLNLWFDKVNQGGLRARPGGDGYLPTLEKAKQTIPVQELLNQSPQQAISDTEGPFNEKDLVPGALLTTKPKDGVLSRSPVAPRITVADRMLVGGPGAWTIVGSDLVTRYNLAGKSTASVLAVLNKNYWKATRPGQFVSAMSVNVRRP